MTHADGASMTVDEARDWLAKDIGWEHIPDNDDSYEQVHAQVRPLARLPVVLPVFHEQGHQTARTRVPVQVRQTQEQQVSEQQRQRLAEELKALAMPIFGHSEQALMDRHLLAAVRENMPTILAALCAEVAGAEHAELEQRRLLDDLNNDETCGCERIEDEYAELQARIVRTDSARAGGRTA